MIDRMAGLWDRIAAELARLPIAVLIFLVVLVALNWSKITRRLLARQARKANEALEDKRAGTWKRRERKKLR
jgi:lipopolysaccharide export LptBFGC system permease protein LptF